MELENKKKLQTNGMKGLWICTLFLIFCAGDDVIIIKMESRVLDPNSLALPL